MIDKIEKIISKYSENKITITPETNFADDLNLNSLDLASMVGDVEETFNCVIPDEDLYSIEKVQDLIDLLERLDEKGVR